MTKEIVAVNPNESVEKVAQLMVEKKVGSVLVYKDQKNLGIITKQNIIARVVLNCNDPCTVKAGDIATKNLITISSEETVKDALKLMSKYRIKRIPVINPVSNNLVGIITSYDILAAFNSLESLSLKSKED